MKKNEVLEKTYDVVFSDDDNDDSKGFKESLEYCKNYIEQNNGTDNSYFADYKGGTVSIICNETGENVYSEKVVNYFDKDELADSLDFTEDEFNQKERDVSFDEFLNQVISIAKEFNGTMEDAIEEANDDYLALQVDKDQLIGLISFTKEDYQKKDTDKSFDEFLDEIRYHFCGYVNNSMKDVVEEANDAFSELEDKSK